MEENKGVTVTEGVRKSFGSASVEGRWKGGNGGRGRNRLRTKGLRRPEAELTRSVRWDCDPF